MSKTERLERARQRTKERKPPKSKVASVDRAESKPPTSSTLYTGFSIWNGKTAPKWHPIKKMRYVFFRMIGGCTITDALTEILWSPSEFWHLVDLKRHAPFREEYQRAKRLQGRAFADSVVAIAEGRDVISRRSLQKMRKIIVQSLKRAGRSKSRVATSAVIESLMSALDANESRVIARNKLQIDSAKWMAKTTNPQEFSEQSKMALTGGLPVLPTGVPDAPIQIQFIGPDGTVVPL